MIDNSKNTDVQDHANNNTANNAQNRKHFSNSKCNPDTTDISSTHFATPPSSQSGSQGETKDEYSLYAMILSYVEAHDPVTFAELMRVLRPCYMVDGELDIFHSRMRHVIFWSKTSQQFMTALEQLIKDKKIHLAPANEVVYGMQGVMLNLPVCDIAHVRLPVYQWMPVFLRRGKETEAMPLTDDEIMKSSMRA